ncbi:MAG: LuxR C-terminal-related transcriptional regulator [Ginsengibacter sp.]
MATLIAMADDKAINRNTFQQKIKMYDDLKLVFMAVNGHDFLQQLKGLPLKKLPEIVFMDIEMPLLNGIQAIQIAKPLYPQIQFIVLSIFDDDEKIFNAIQAGASGYLLKEETDEGIRNAINNCKEYGGAPMSPAIARKAFDLLSRVDYKPANTSEKSNQVSSLISEREKEILKFIIHGLDAKRIAETLNISTFTVRKHISNVYEKLQVNSRAQVMTLAHEHKWFE